MPNDPSIADVIMHPVRLRILQQLSGRSLTTAQLRDALPDVKQATLYRHVSALLDAGMVAVIRERRVRGAVERTLGLGEQMAHVDEEGLRAMSDAQLRSAFLAFVTEVTADFDRVLEQDDEDLRGLLGFGRRPIYVDTDDLAAIQEGFAQLLAPYLEDRGDGKQRLSFGTVVLPEPGPGAPTAHEQ